MGYFEAAFAGKNSFWRYIVMFVGAFLASNLIGGIPILIISTIKIVQDPGAADMLTKGGGMLTSIGVDPLLSLALMLFPFLVGLAFLILVFNILHQRKPITLISAFGKVRWGRLLFSAFVWMLISAFYLFVYLKIDPSNFSLNNTSVTLLYLAIIALLLIPFQAAFEEVLFRGYLMQGFGVLTRNRWMPLLLTSILFGLLHMVNPEVKEFGFLTMMPQYMLFGLIFAVSVVMDEGIEIAIGAHAANNIFLSVFVTFDSAALQTPALFEQLKINPWKEFAGLAVMALLFLVIMGLKYNWPSIKRLFESVKPEKSPEAIQVP